MPRDPRLAELLLDASGGRPESKPLEAPNDEDDLDILIFRFDDAAGPDALSRVADRKVTPLFLGTF